MTLQAISERVLITGGTVLQPHDATAAPVLADVLIQADRIEAIARDLSVADARVIDATDHYVLPGFIDTHRHTWQSVLRNVASDWSLGQYISGMHFGMSRLYRPEDTYVANNLGLTEALDAGITTMLDWSHGLATPDHADAAIEGLKAAGARAVFAHGGGAPQWQVPSDVAHPVDVLRIQKEHFATDDQLVTLAFAARGPQYATERRTIEDWALARRLGVRVTVHVGDGEWGRHGPVRFLHSNGLTGPEVTYVHGNTISDEEVRMIVDTGGTVSIAADIETQMGHGWPATGRFLDAGLRPSLSIDVCSSNGGDMFHAMKATITTQRALDNDSLPDATAANNLRLTCRDVVQFATEEGARALGLERRIGTLEVGKEADIILIRSSDLSMVPHNNPYGAIVYNAHAGMVDTVLVAGKVVKEHGELVNRDLRTLREDALASAGHLIARAAETADISTARPGGAWRPGPAQG